MHASSMENMYLCFQQYMKQRPYDNDKNYDLIDIGGANVNGSYADIFSDSSFNYRAVDIAEGEGIDVVLDDPYKLPFEDSSIDIIISGQAFEHVEFFWQSFLEMKRVLKQDGVIFLIAPSSGPIHRYPVDCYRFYPDAFYALGKYANITTMDVWRDERGPWQDLVGVFSNDTNLQPFVIEQTKTCTLWPLSKYEMELSPAPTNIPRRDDSIEAIQGSTNYQEILAAFHDQRQSMYLEIGIRKGKSLSLAKGSAIAIDPEPDIDENLTIASEKVQIFETTSDIFFRHYAADTLGTNKITMAFIDGMHIMEFALRDFINVEQRSTHKTVVFIDDIYPNHPIQAERERESQVWTGDVWKFAILLSEVRPDLKLTWLDTSPTGLLMVEHLKPNNQILTNRYNPLVRKYRNLNIQDYYDIIINRINAESPQTLLEKLGRNS